MNYYSCQELETKALSTERTDEAINNLGKWYSFYGDTFWNGECYTGKFEGREYSLYPVYSEPDEDDYSEIIGWELH